MCKSWIVVDVGVVEEESVEVEMEEEMVEVETVTPSSQAVAPVLEVTAPGGVRM